MNFAREIKKANKWYRKGAGAVITGILSAVGVPGPVAHAVGSMIGARVNGASLEDSVKAGAKGYVVGHAFAQTGELLDDKLISTGEAVAAHAVIGGIQSDWNGGSFSDGALSGAVGKFVTIRTEGMSLGGRYLATAGTAGIVAELTGSEFNDGVVIASLGFFLNEMSGRSVSKRPEGTPDNFVETTSPISGETIWVHPDHVYKSATYSPPSNISAESIANSADYVSTGFGAVATYGYYTGQMYMVLPAATISFLAQGVEWYVSPPTPTDTFAWYTDQLIGSANISYPALKLGVEVLNPFQSTLSLIGD